MRSQQHHQAKSTTKEALNPLAMRTAKNNSSVKSVGMSVDQAIALLRKFSRLR